MGHKPGSKIYELAMKQGKLNRQGAPAWETESSPPSRVPVAAKPARASSMNKAEAEYLALYLKPRLDKGELIAVAWEAFKLPLASGWRMEPAGGGKGRKLRAMTYAPDFVALKACGGVEFHEVKGGFVREDSLVKFKSAVQLYGNKFVFFWAEKGKSSWKVEKVKVE